jgi:DNA-binding MarR family transcriptional regulator
MAILRRTSVIDGKLVIEEIEDENLVTVRKKDKMNGGEFIVVFQKAMEKIVLDNSFGKNEYRILFYLMAKTEFEQEINDTLYNIAKSIGLDQSTAGKSMIKLENVGIVVRNIQLRTFRLNYELAYKGQAKNYKKLQFKDPAFLKNKKTTQTSIIKELEDLENL